MGIMSTMSTVFHGCGYFDHSQGRATAASTKRMRTDLRALLTSIIRLFEVNRIRYAIRDGTLLGALRQGNFIPWDDDIDISVHAADWNRFEALLPQPELLSTRILWDDGGYLRKDRDRSPHSC